jgi:hypothetical protein
LVEEKNDHRPKRIDDIHPFCYAPVVIEML